MTLNDVAILLDKNKKKSSVRYIDDYKLPEFKLPESPARGHETRLKKQLAKTYATVKYLQYLRKRDVCTILPLSTTSSKLQSIWGNHRNVSNGLQFMQQIGLIEVEDETYQFGAYYDSDNHCKLYRYYYENELKLLDKAESYKVNFAKTQWMPLNYSQVIDWHTIAEKCKNTVFGFERSQVRFVDSGLHLEKPTDFTPEEHELYLLGCLYENYKGFEYFQKLADSINADYYMDNIPMAIQFKPHFHWGRGKYKDHVIGISIRACNSLCNMEKSQRRIFLSENGYFLEDDVVSSVPRINISLNNGEWYSGRNDIYKDIYDRLHYKTCAFNQEIRNSIKTIHLRAFFEHSDGTLYAHAHNKIVNEDSYDLTANEKYELRSLLTDLRHAIESAEGYLYGSYVFYVESCVYMMVLKDILDAGYKCWQVFDCFYAKPQPGKTEEDFKNLIEESLKIRFEEFVNIEQYGYETDEIA